MHLYEVQNLLSKGENNLDRYAVFDKLNSQGRRLQVISLLKDKKLTVNFLLFKNRIPRCEKLVEKYP